MAKSPIPSVFVIGPLLLEHHIRVEGTPRPGSRVAAEGYDQWYAGRGGGHSIAVTRAGCDAVLVSALGEDFHGLEYREFLESEGIKTRHILHIKGRTGTTFLMKNAQGADSTIEWAGPLQDLAPADIRGASAALNRSKAFLGDLAVPSDVLEEAVRRANEAGVPVIIRASPILTEFAWGELRTDYLIVSMTELLLMFGQTPESLPAEELKNRLAELRWEHLIVTRGSSDTLIFGREGGFWSIPTLPVLPIDQTGAGDAFAGCFAAAIAKGLELPDAVKAANCAGALTTLGLGAHCAIPDWEAVELHLRHLEQE